MANGLLSQGAIRSVTEGSSVSFVSQSAIRSVLSYAAEGGLISQSALRSVDVPDTNSLLSQGLVRVVWGGAIEDPSIRAWTYSMDGHDFYILRLGETETLVYDTLSEEWYTWGSGDSPLWLVRTGHNWLGGDLLSNVYGSNVLVGDDTTGNLFFLNPDQAYDASRVMDGDPTYFRRRISAQAPLRGYSRVPCYGVELFGSIGVDATTSPFDTVTLEYSDDGGSTYVIAAAIAAPDGEDTRLFWRSLGSMKNPGRIFRVTDNGALRRIDAMEMLDGSARP